MNNFYIGELTEINDIVKIINMAGKFTLIVGAYQSDIRRDGNRLIITKKFKDGWLWPDGPWPADHNQLVIDEHGDMYENLADYGEEEQLYKKTPNSFHAHPWVAVDRNDWSKWYTHIHALIMRARLYDIAAKWVYYLKEEKARDDRAEFESFLKERRGW